MPYTYEAMEFFDDRFQTIEKWLLAICKGLLCGVSGITFLMLSYFAVGKLYSPAANSVCQLPVVCKASLGEGVLALTTRAHSPAVESILHELILVGVSTRPDQDHDQQLTLALRSSGEQKKVFVGEPVFLTKGALGFSAEETGMTLLPFSLENGQVLCKLLNPNTEQFILTPSPVFSRSLAQESYVETLKKGELCGTDVFLSGWGGDEYRDLTKKLKIAVGADVFFLRPGDCLWWNGQQWTEEPCLETMGPIAELKKASSQGAHFQIWDETGFSSEKIQLSSQASSQPHFKMEELMTAVRPRSSSEITCQLGKRRVIVKEGDWWVRTDNRWKQVRTAADLEALLYHQIPGELFIFEKVETSKGKITLKGRAFDRMRTSSEPISLVVQAEKKNVPHSRKSTSGNPALLAKNRAHRPALSNSSKEAENL